MVIYRRSFLYYKRERKRIMRADKQNKFGREMAEERIVEDISSRRRRSMDKEEHEFHFCKPFSP